MTIERFWGGYPPKSVPGPGPEPLGTRFPDFGKKWAFFWHFFDHFFDQFRPRFGGRFRVPGGVKKMVKKWSFFTFLVCHPAGLAVGFEAPGGGEISNQESPGRVKCTFWGSWILIPIVKRDFGGSDPISTPPEGFRGSISALFYPLPAPETWPIILMGLGVWGGTPQVRSWVVTNQLLV